MLQFIPETKYYDDQPGPIANILKKQKTLGMAPNNMTQVKMSKFVEAIVKRQ